jgi:hypothetical protein
MTEMDFEAQLRTIAGRMKYPPTPDIAGAVSARLRAATRPRFQSKAVAWSLTIVLILLSSLMLIPSARAAIIEFIQVGVVRIFRSEPVPAPQQIPGTMVPVTATPLPTPQPLIPVLRNLAGERTLQEAQQSVKYRLALPTYPGDLGEPDYVFMQDQGAMTILVRLDPQNPDEVLMSLHFIPEGSWVIKKMELTVIKETQVNGQYAIWTTGPYPMRLENGDIRSVRMIQGHVLIWEDDAVTYRLETNQSLAEAVKTAESLEPLKSP